MEHCVPKINKPESSPSKPSLHSPGPRMRDDPFVPWLRAALLAAAALAAPSVALAQNGSDYPSRPIRPVVPYPPRRRTAGSPRIVQARSQPLRGQPVLIDNRGGAAGSIGTELVAKSAPDGYTVLFTLSSHTINPAIYA